MTIEAYHRITSMLVERGHEIFTIKFRRRNDKVVAGEVVARAGDIREMRCRLHVTKGVKGVEPNRKEVDRGIDCVTVFEMAAERSGFKRIPVDGIVEVNGERLDG